MRIEGQETQNREYRRAIQLPRPDGTVWTFQMRPLSLGFHRRLHDRGLLLPQPPVRVARDSQGRIQRDEQGHAVTIVDARDPTHLQAVQQYQQRVAVLAVAESLQADPMVTFETPLPSDLDNNPTVWSDYADKIFAELEVAGFSPGDLVRLCQCVCRISNLINDDLHTAQANFSSPNPINTT